MNDWIPAQVAERRNEAEDIISLVLKPADGSVLPAYEAGAHIDLRLPNGLVRQYSLCGERGADNAYQLGILLEPEGRGGSRYVHERIVEGDVIEISAPRNLFAIEPSKRSLLFAGGIGITPIIAMADQLEREGRDFALHYSTRTAARAAFRDRIAGSSYAARAFHHFDDRPETRLDVAALLATPDERANLYVCGPDGFMNHVLGTARALGWPEARLHSERFSAAVTQSAEDAAFELEIEGSGQIVPVAAGQTALDALNAAGIEIPVSCEQGICGTCLTTVVAGIPDHRDMYLSPEERAANDCFTPCCSRALSPRLVIQL